MTARSSFWQFLATSTILAAFPGVAPGQQCPITATNALRPNKLYLYFPSTDDMTFPNYAAQVSPAKKFDTTLLTSYLGNATEVGHV
jgi:hypothetical protein